MKKRLVNSVRLALLAASVAASGAAFAQTATPDIDELKAKLAESEAVLKEEIANRDATAAKAEKINTKLEEQEQRRKELEEQFRELCEQQEKLSPGTMQDCMAKMEG